MLQVQRQVMWGWSGDAKVSCILSHQGVQLKLAYSWARPAILVAGKDRGGMFLFLLFHHFYSCSYFFLVPLFHLFYYLFYLFSLSVGDDTKWPTRVDVSLNPNTINCVMLCCWQCHCNIARGLIISAHLKYTVSHDLPRQAANHFSFKIYSVQLSVKADWSSLSIQNT